MAQTKIREGQTDIAIRDFTDSEVKEQINTTTYDTFGLLIKVDDDNIIYFIRQGTSHVGDKGKIVGQKYTLSTRTWGTRYDVYEDANGDYDSRNVSGGIIGSNIYLFFLRYNLNTTTIIDIGYIKSTDLTGTSWGNYTSVATGLTDPNTYGSIVETSVSGKYLIPVRGTDGADSAIILLETTDSGDNWAVGDTIYTGAVTYTETCITHIGSGKMIALIRNNAGSYVNQSMSADNGETWSAPALTNLGASTGEKIPWIIYNSYSNKVISIYVDRTDYLVKIAEGNADDVYASVTAWDTPIGVNYLSPEAGYSSIVPITGTRFFYVYPTQISASDVDTYGGTYEQTLINPSIDFEDNAVKQNVLVKAYNSNTQTFTASGWAKVEYDTEVWDIGSDWDTANYRFRAPVSGFYRVKAGVIFDNLNNDKACYLSIYVNGSEYATDYVCNGSFPDSMVTVSDLVYCPARQYIEIYAVQTDSVSRDIKTVSTRSKVTISLESL